MDNIIGSWTSQWEILFALFLTFNLLSAIKLFLRRKIKQHESLSLLKLTEITALLDADEELSATESEMKQIVSNIKENLKTLKPDFNNLITDIVKMTRVSFLITSSFYFSLLITSSFITSGFYNSFISFYTIIILYLGVAIYQISTKGKESVYKIFIYLFFIAPLIISLEGIVFNWYILAILNEFLAAIPFTAIMPVIATFAPILFYIVWLQREKSFINYIEKTITKSDEYISLIELYSAVKDRSYFSKLTNEQSKKINNIQVKIKDMAKDDNS
jgi:hypothetical protein